MNNQGVFIGLGGAGVYATGHLKARLLKAAGKDKERLRESCQFIFIDTDNRAYNRINALYAKEFDGQKLIDEDWLSFSSVAPKFLFRRAKGQKALGNLEEGQDVLLTFVDEKSAASFKTGRLEEGASANRQQGRVALWSQWRSVQTRINACIENLKSPNNSEQSPLSIPFYILSGTCGGTGSSMFLDVAYLVDRTVKSHFKERDPIVRAVLFMPEWYIQQYKKESNDDIVRKYQSNSYAFFEELNYFLADNYAGEEQGLGEKFGKLFVAPRIDEQVEDYNRKWGVFNFAICVDSTSEQEGKFDDEQMYQNTAEMLYHWHQNEVQGAFVSSFDNQLLHQYLGKKRVPAFITMGYRALQFPGDLLSEFCTARFLYEFFANALLDEDGAGAREYLRSEAGRRWLAQVLDDSARAQPNEGQENGRGTLLTNARNTIAAATRAFAYQQQGGFVTQVRKRLRWAGGHVNSSYDPAKVGDATALDQFKLNADNGIMNAEQRLEQDLNGSGGASAQAQLVARVERALEEAFMAFGLDGALLVAKQLAAKVAELSAAQRSETDRHASELQSLESAIAEARNTCLQKRDDQCLSNLRRLYEQKLVVACGLVEVRRRAALLKALDGFKGPSGNGAQKGLLGAYVESLTSMKRQVENRLLPAAGEGGSISQTYKRTLKERFGLLRDTVTTAYVPNVTTLVRGGEYDEDHPFSRTYADIVKRVSRDGRGRGPLRRGAHETLWSDPQGLHGLMIKIFQEEEEAEADGGLPRGESFFRRYLKAPLSEHREMARQLEAIGRRAITRLLEQKGIGGASRSVEEAFNSLPDDERERIKQDFVGRTETFCRMDESMRGKPLDVTLYVGPSDELASSLGYSEGAGGQFIRTTDPSRFLLIKAKALWTIEQYPFYDQYRLIYDAERRRRDGGNGIHFSPHIHKLFNELGVADGMRRLLRPSADLDVYLLTLLYDRMFRVAQQHFYPLFREAVHWDGSYRGDQATKASPLEWVSGAEGAKVVHVVQEVGSRGGKLLFEKGAFKVVVTYNNLRHLFNRLEASHPRLFTRLQKVDDSFRQTCRKEWASDDGPLARGYAEVDAMLTPKPREGQQVPEEVLSWYAAMRNRLYELHAELAGHILSQPSAAGIFSGTPSDDYEPDL